MAREAVATMLRRVHWSIGPPSSVEEASDGQLLGRFLAEGEEAAFAALVRRHGRLVHNVCLRILQHRHDAEDAFQATFLVLARKAGAIRKRDSLASWLYGVAYRIAVRAKARATGRAELSSEGVDMMQPDPAQQAAWRELQPILDAEVARLPERYQAPLLLCYFEGKSNEEAARLLGWPSGTVKGRMARARELLRERLGRRGLSLSVGTVAVCLSGQAMAAPLPSRLVESTVNATMQLVAGPATAAGIAAPAVALCKGELRAMFIAKLKIMSAVAVLATVGVWAGVSQFHAQAEVPNATARAVQDAAPEANAAAEAPKATAADAAKPAGFEGRWTAKVEVGDESILVRFEFEKNDKNEWKGTLRTGKDLIHDLQKIKVNGSKIQFDCDECGDASLSFVGELKDGSVSGTLEMLGKNNGLKEGTWSMSRR